MHLYKISPHDSGIINHSDTLYVALLTLYNTLLQVIGALQLILAGWAIYKMVWIRYAPDPDERWFDNELEYWFPPGNWNHLAPVECICLVTLWRTRKFSCIEIRPAIEILLMPASPSI